MIALLIALVRQILIVPFAPILWLRRMRAAPRGGWVRLTIAGRLAEYSVGQRRRFALGGLLGRPQRATSIDAVRTLCTELEKDPRPRGLVVELEPIDAGFAAARALGEIFSHLRSAGKDVHVHLPKGASLREYFIAVSGTSISMPAHASLHLVGLGTKSLYLKEALAAFGLEAEVEQRHEFKSAGETFSRNDMSAVARAQAERLLTEIEQAVYGAITERRGLLARDVLSRGPYRAREAKALGLIDREAFTDTLEEELDEHGDVPAWPYVTRRRTRVFRTLRPKKRIAVVRVSGVIVDESTMPGQASTASVCAALTAAKESRRIAGVVLLVNSRGGSAFASAEMHRAVVALRAKKPVVAYFGDYAASGGYYVAAHATEIWSSPLSVTGSIGVISMRPVADALLERLHIHKDGAVRGEHSGLLDALGRWSQAEQAAMRRQIDALYDEFTAVVADGRKLDAAELDLLARGRVFLGASGDAKKLVDHTGSFREAFERTRTLAGARTAPEPVLLGTRRMGLPWFVGATAFAGPLAWLREKSWLWQQSWLLPWLMREPLAYEPLEVDG